MLDNYDSFTFNLVQYFSELGAEVTVERNDCVTVEQVVASTPDQLVVSPGPCTPEKAGISVALIQQMAGQVPIFGVCLGHQCIGAAFGAKIVRAGKIMHGKTSLVHHLGSGVFHELPSPFTITRYHSLVIDRATLPDCLEVTAWTETGEGEIEEVMGVRHRSMAVEGVQFHPESILTEYGHDMLNNFLKGRLHD